MLRPFLFQNIRKAIIIGEIDIKAWVVEGSNNIEKVDFFIDGEMIGTDDTSPYDCRWKQEGVSGFKHSIEAIVHDTEGMSGSHMINVLKFS